MTGHIDHFFSLFKILSNIHIFKVNVILAKERLRGVATLARQVSAERVVFGSYFPLFYIESAALKMREAGLSDEDFRAIREGNAQRLLNA